jgi:hypothetical protein
MERMVVGATRREKDEDLGGVNRDRYAGAEYADFGVEFVQSGTGEASKDEERERRRRNEFGVEDNLK